jgi:hypothetical protein
MHADCYPRTAIVAANPLTPVVSNGLLMRSLFAGWPRQRLAQVCFPISSTIIPPSDVCEDCRVIALLGRVRKLGQRHPSGDGANEAPTAATHFSPRLTLLGMLKQKPRLLPWLRLAQEAWYGNSWIRRTLERQLLEISPEVVYALLGNYCLTKITYQVCAKLGLPLYIHVTDDFVRSLYRPLPLGNVVADASEKWFRRIVNYSRGRAGISADMAEEFQERYGGHWDWFTTGVYPRAYDPSDREDDGVVRFVYAGNLGLGRWRQLRALALALDRLARGGRARPCLEIYAAADQLHAHRAALTVPSVVRLMGWAPHDSLPGIFHNSDVLVHAESFDLEVAALTRLSLSTKLTQYFMAGRCVLGFGPSELSSMRLIRNAGAGLTICSDEETIVTEQVSSLCVDRKARQHYGQRGRQWAERWGDRDKQHERFQASLAQCARGVAQNAA